MTDGDDQDDDTNPTVTYPAPVRPPVPRFEEPDEEAPTQVEPRLFPIDAPPTAADRPSAKAAATRAPSAPPRPPPLADPNALRRPSDDEWLFEELVSDTVVRPRAPAPVLTGDPASLAQRLGAWLIDFSLIVVAARFVASDGELRRLAAMHLAAGPLLVLFAAMVAIGVAYELLGALLWGRSIGRLVFGIQLVDKGGDPPGLLRSLGRALLSVVSWFGGFLFTFFDRRGQMLHDKLTSTWVVRNGTSGLR